jgi:hypothetical protein
VNREASNRMSREDWSYIKEMVVIWAATGTSLILAYLWMAGVLR